MIRNPVGSLLFDKTVVFDNPNSERIRHLTYFSNILVKLFTEPNILPPLGEQVLLQLWDFVEKDYYYLIGFRDQDGVYFDNNFLNEFEKENSFENEDFRLVGWFLLP